jgi:hypothetical protein
MSKMSELEYETRMAAEPKFAETYCSQCGQNLGPGDSGVSHCKDHMRLEELSPALRKAAEAVIDRWFTPNWTHDAVHTGELIAALRDALQTTGTALQEYTLVRLSNTHQQLGEVGPKFGEQFGEQLGEQYELIGTIDGTYAGRWMIATFAENAAAVWPDGTAVYVRRVKE